MASAPPPVLNDTAPQVNLLQQWFHAGGQAVQTHPSGQLPTFDITGIVPVVFSLVFIVWAIYTLVVIYHWFRYRHKSWFAVPMIVIHLFVSGSIILFMVSGLK